MYIKDWKNDVFTIPNLLSMFRILLIPVYIHMYLNANRPLEYVAAASILAVSCITDAIDGKIARRFHMVSHIGKLLDPVADKLTQLTLTICLSIKYPVLNPVLAIFIIKESFQLIAVIVNLKQGKALPGALMAGKVCTTVLFISLIILVLFPQIPVLFVDFIAFIDGGLLLISFACYLGAYLGSQTSIQDIEP